MERLLYNQEEAAELLGVSKWTVAWLIRTGKLPKRKIGRKFMLTPQDLQALIDNSAAFCAANRKET